MSELTDAFKNAGDGIKDAWSQLTDTSVTPHVFSANKRMADSLVPNPKVLAEEILKKDAISCSITIPIPEWKNGTMVYTTTTIPFYMQSDFGFSLGNKWQPLIQTDGGIFEALTNGISMLKKDTQITLQSQSMSAASWKESTTPTFNVDCLFICTNRRINPVEIIKTLAKACLPTKIRDFTAAGGKEPQTLAAMRTLAKTAIKFPVDLWKSLADDAQDQAADTFLSQVNNQIDECGMVAPLSYGVQLDDNFETGVKPLPGTTLALHIGDYFHANELLVENISNISFSKELVAPPSTHNKKGNTATTIYDSSTDQQAYGFPLYAKCQISLRPYCLVDYKTFMNYFQVTKGSPGAYGRNTIDAVDSFYSSKNDITELPK